MGVALGTFSLEWVGVLQPLLLLLICDLLMDMVFWRWASPGLISYFETGSCLDESTLINW